MTALLFIDREASTVTIAGRRYPAVALICPQDTEPRPDRDRALAVGGGDQSVYIPAENGLLFRVEEGRNERYHGLSLEPNARTCRQVEDYDGWMWLPWTIGVIDGVLVPGASNCWYWAEPEWVVETIDRLSRKSFMQPDGPLVQLVRLNHFDEAVSL